MATPCVRIEKKHNCDVFLSYLFCSPPRGAEKLRALMVNIRMAKKTQKSGHVTLCHGWHSLDNTCDNALDNAKKQERKKLPFLLVLSIMNFYRGNLCLCRVQSG